MSGFTSWVQEIASSISDVGNFFANIAKNILPQPLIEILFFFPAILVVYWIYRSFKDLPGGD